MRNNESLIDFLRFSLPDSGLLEVCEILGIPPSEFGSESRSSPFPNYQQSFNFANIEVHVSSSHTNALVNMSGQACRQYEEFLLKVAGWHWQSFLESILMKNAKITRIDLALDIFDSTSPSVRKIQDYVKRGQLSTKAHKFIEINSGRISDGKLTGFTLYVGSNPQILRIYDKKQERADNADEEIFVERWIRWELELSDTKAMQAVRLIVNGRPVSVVIKGILSAHYSFKSQKKGKIETHNKDRLPTMKWWVKFIGSVEKMPLRIEREKTTMKKKKKWIEKSTSKSLAMVYTTLESAYGQDLAKIYLQDLIEEGKEKFTKIDDSMVRQRVLEILSEDEY